MKNVGLPIKVTIGDLERNPELLSFFIHLVMSNPKLFRLQQRQMDLPIPLEDSFCFCFLFRKMSKLKFFHYIAFCTVTLIAQSL